MNRKLFGIFREKPWLSVLIIIYLTGMIAYSVPKSKTINEASDYWVFWQSGKDFSDKHELYYRDIVRPYYYPPFAAFLFQPLHILSLQNSALIFFLFNALFLIPFSIYLIYKIIKILGLNKRKTKVALILTTLLTLQYFWLNLAALNINCFLFVITLIGIYFLVLKKPHVAGILFTIIAFIKIMPVLLAGYVFLFHFSRKVFLTMIFTTVICLSVLIPFRGVDLWLQDHVDLYEKVVDQYILEGRIVANNANHSLKAGVIKAFHPESRNNQHVYPEQYPVTTKIITILELVFLGILMVNGVILRRRKVAFSIAYLASIMLFIHLISGITWTAHLVTMMFCLLPVVLIDNKRLRSPGKIAFYFVLAILFFLGIEGRDTFGVHVYQALRYYDVYTMLMIGLFLFCSWVVWNKQSHKIYPEGAKFLI